MRKLIFILLMVTSLVITSCGEELDNTIPITTQINMNGFLDNFRGGKITVEIFNNTSTTCEIFLDPLATTDESFEKDINLDIPEGNEDIQLSKENITITPGVKTIYASLYNKDGEKKGHACQKAIKCSSIGTTLTEDSYNIAAGDKACVYLSISLIE